MTTTITLPRAVVEQALGALDAFSWEQVDAARIALRAALAEPVQEPVALKWLPAPRKTEWGFGMVSADVEIDRDHTLTMYCEDDQTAKVDAMFRRVFCKEKA
jgi:hypothetical protein